jgi:hypothetical protein
MLTITKKVLIAALLLGLAPAAHAREGQQPEHPRYSWPLAQQRAYWANEQGWADPTHWLNPNSAESAYAREPLGHVTPATTRHRGAVKNKPLGSAWQDRGIRKDLGHTAR